MSTQTEKKPASVEVKNAIRARLKANMKLDRRELAAHYNVSNNVVGAIYTHLKIAEINQTFDKLNKVISKVGKKKAHKQGVFTNQAGANKEVARDKMANAIILSNVVGIIPTLPNKTWAIEQKIAMGLKGIEYLGVENNLEIFTAMKRALKKLP